MCKCSAIEPLTIFPIGGVPPHMMTYRSIFTSWPATITTNQFRTRQLMTIKSIALTWPTPPAPATAVSNMPRIGIDAMDKMREPQRLTWSYRSALRSSESLEKWLSAASPSRRAAQ